MRLKITEVSLAPCKLLDWYNRLEGLVQRNLDYKTRLLHMRLRWCSRAESREKVPDDGLSCMASVEGLH